MYKNEVIIWKGQPKYKLRWAFIEIIGGGAESGPLIGILPIIFLLNIIGLIKFYRSEQYFIFSILCIFMFFLLFGTEFHKRIRRKHTKYIVTTHRISIHDYWYGRDIMHEIPLSNVIKFYLELYKDDSGVIHVFLKDKTFHTRDFWSGGVRANATLEDIEQAQSVYKKLNQNLVAYHKKGINNV